MPLKCSEALPKGYGDTRQDETFTFASYAGKHS